MTIELDDTAGILDICALCAALVCVDNILCINYVMYHAIKKVWPT